MSIVSGIIFLFLPPFDVRKWKKGEKDKDDPSQHLLEKNDDQQNDPFAEQQRAIAEQTKLLGPVRYWFLISSATLYLMLYVTLEATFGSYISEYTYKMGMASIETSSYVASVFWGGFCLGRGLSVITSTRLSPRMMCFFGILSATLVMAVFVVFKDVCITIIFLFALFHVFFFLDLVNMGDVDSSWRLWIVYCTSLGFIVGIYG